ncbi:MAG: LAGLIDADG family homing endonuclease [Chromatiales bacterium]|nr:LAGLIDADG family homing endonuclease [Chromatiales bacterium]
MAFSDPFGGNIDSDRIGTGDAGMDVKKLSSTDAAYLAGLIDGEGTVTLSRKHRNENRQLAVTISNTEKPLLDFVLATIGAGKITGKRTARSNHAPSFAYAIYNRQALRLLEQVYPHLRTYKAERAALILRDYLALTPRNGKYSENLLRRRRLFEATVLELRPG